MWRKLAAAAAVVAATLGGGVARADKPFTFRAARFDCREYGEFVYAPPSQRHVAPWGELDGERARAVGQMFYTMEAGFPNSGFFILDETFPYVGNPKLTVVTCEAYYLDTDNVFVSGWASVAVPNS